MAAWALLYALVFFYASTVVSPLGYSPKPLTLAQATAIFRGIRYVSLGSDQQADWMANLLALVPLGFLLALALGGRRWPARLLGGFAALVLCLGYVVAVKFVQVFFPRTVDLNYVIAQSVGAGIGVSAGVLGRGTIARGLARLARRGPESLVVILAVASAGIFAFMLVPFDFVVTRADLAARLQALPGLLVQMPGGGLPWSLRIAMLGAGMLGVVPVGMLLALLQPARAMGWIAVQAVAAMALATVAAAFVMGASPALVNVPLRAGCIVVGAMALRWVCRHDISAYRRALFWAALLLAPAYLVALAVVNGLATPQWRGLDAAMAAVDQRFYLPLWTHYIVTKAQAVRADLSQMAMYAPVGLAMWAWGGRSRSAVWGAGLVGFGLSAAVEYARWMKPGFLLDINNPAFAAVSAALTARVMPYLWEVLCRLHGPSDRPEVSAPAGSLVADLGGVAVLAACLAGVGDAVWHYPLSRDYLAVALGLYAALLIWRPAAWLLVIPVVVPAWQLGPWTGWQFLAEGDLFVIVTLGVLMVRLRPGAVDLAVGRVPGAVMLVFLGCAAISLGIGLALPGPAGSADVYMSWLDGPRLVKPLALAWLLLPFAAQRQRTRGDALELFALGMTLGLCVVALQAGVERWAFVGPVLSGSAYRIAGPFASMHVGGGHIGAYLAMALPFAVICVLRWRGWGVPAFLVAVCLGAATLGLTFARTAYAAGGLGVLVTGAAMVVGARQRAINWRAALAGAAAMSLAVFGVVGVAATSDGFMAGRLRKVVPDLDTRTANWRDGLALWGAAPLQRAFGMGSGSYLRLSDRRGDPLTGPSDFRLGADQNKPFLSLQGRAPLYFGQKVAATPGSPVMLSLRSRLSPGATGGSISVSLCEKYLLYSMNCAGTGVKAGPRWSTFSAGLMMPQTESIAGAGWPHRPVELGLSVSPQGGVEVADIHLVAADGTELLANGSFAEGTSRWFFTADNHIGWRILDQYLMTLLENGVAGLVTLATLFVVAVASAAAALRRGRMIAAAALGAIGAVLVSFVFDAVLEAQSLALLIYLMLGLLIVVRPRRSSHPA